MVSIIDGWLTDGGALSRCGSSLHVVSAYLKKAAYVFKLAPLTWTTFDLVLVTDNDAFYVHQRPLLHLFSHEQVLHHGPLIMFCNDNIAPTNAGYILANPSTAWATM